MKIAMLYPGIVLLMFITSCGNDSPTQESTRQATTVTASIIDLQHVGETIHFSGTVEPYERVRLSTRISGWAEVISVSEGQSVQSGTVLARLRSDDIKARQAQAEASIAEAEAHYRNAQINLQRIESLFDKGAATSRELDDMRAAFAAAAARRKMAESMLKEVSETLRYTILKAPFDGVVTRKYLEQGDLVNAGQSIMEIENVRRMKIIAKVPGSELTNMTPGRKVQIYLTNDTGDSPYPGIVDQVIPSANPVSRQFDVKILIDNPDRALKSGMYARVALSKAGDVALLVPQQALVRRGQLTGLFVVGGDSRARLRWIREGRSYQHQVEILSGLNPGDRVVTEDLSRMYDGMAVEVR